MARYIKANPKVVAFLHLEDTRNQLQDGNYLLWQADMLELDMGSLVNLPAILDAIGGIALSAHEAREEQDGTVLRPLPVATDPRFIYTPPTSPQTQSPETGENAPQAAVEEQEGQGISPEAESPAEGAETAQEGNPEENAGDGDGNEPENTEED